MFVITGGSSGIGRSLALALAKRGKKVLIIGRREKALQEVAKQAAGIDYCCADVSTPEGRETIYTHLQPVAAIDGLIHNAGVIEPIVDAKAIDETQWHQLLATNLDAPLFLSQKLLPQLKTGRVLHIGSGAAHFPVKGWAAYCVSKAALAMLTRCLQLESDTTLFASVMPGIIDTPMQATIRQAEFMDEDKHTFFNQLYTQKQLVSPQTVAEFLSWLLLDVPASQYAAKEWDIYDKSHHKDWLKPPHCVPEWETS